MRTLLIFLTATIFPLSADGDDSGIWVADGLQIHLAADDDLVPDCMTLAVDPLGRVVASGRGYIRMLIDDDADGTFDRFETLVGGPEHGAHGLCFDGHDLYFVGDDGVWKVTDTDHDRRVDSTPTRVLEIKTGGEHDAHALRKGPDGDWYLIAGNGTKGMFDLQNVEQPAITNPRAGAIWRISPDWSRRDVWAHGFRNAYDFDFAPDGKIDTFDSDGERDVSLPWYRPTRVFRVARGDDAGWMTRAWKRPDSDPNMPRLLASFGRGSPTGVMRYRHGRLPERFHGRVLVLDWTFGRILAIDDDGNSELVARPEGDAGFAVTDIDSLADGRVVISVGGRRSRGGIYIMDAIDSHFASTEKPMLWLQQTDNDSSPLAESIAALRGQVEKVIDHQAFQRSVELLAGHENNPRQQLAALTLLAESVGGLGEAFEGDRRGRLQTAAVFDGYRTRLFPSVDADVKGKLIDALIQLIDDKQTPSDVRHEAIRGLAIIEPESPAALTAVVADMERCDSPIEMLHRLIAIARLPIPRSDAITERVCEALIEIPIRVDALGLNVDQNWRPRLGECFAALRYYDSLLPAKLVSHPGFSHPSHLVWTERMHPESLERARRRFLQSGDHHDFDPAVARFIALGDDAVPRRFIRLWLDDPATRASGWLAIASHPAVSDGEQLAQAALSLDPSVRSAATQAMNRLGIEIPLRHSSSETVQQWLERAERITALTGDTSKGQKLFVAGQCTSCHNGATALGPSLAGISKRFGPADVLRATVDPNHTIPDRYQAKQVLITDDRVVVGMPIYESVDGITLVTADGKTLRLNAEMIREIKTAPKSLMPEGLIDGLDDQQVADLIAYLRTL